MRVRIKTVLASPSADVWHKVKQSQTLVYVTKGLMSFDGAEHFPVQWHQDLKIDTRLKLFEIAPLWSHQLLFEMICEEQRILLTQEGGGLVSEWRHFIQVETKDKNSCYYLDEVEIKAGLLTPLISAFAWFFYRYRQWRWKKLLTATMLPGDQSLP